LHCASSGKWFADVVVVTNITSPPARQPYFSVFPDGQQLNPAIKKVRLSFLACVVYLGFTI
jgi:cytochrome c biogenesis factor